MRSDLRNAIKEIEHVITAPSLKHDYDENYRLGMEEALNIILKHCDNGYEVGKTYYVVMPKDDISNTVVKMCLYKICEFTKVYYYFCKLPIEGKYKSTDLVLSNTKSLEMRVFNTREEAEAKVDIMVWRSEHRRR